MNNKDEGAALAEMGFCFWEKDEVGVFETGCNNLFVLNDGTPNENSMVYCCYCGSRIKTDQLNSE